jgi:hypothetical protein
MGHGHRLLEQQINSWDDAVSAESARKKWDGGSWTGGGSRPAKSKASLCLLRNGHGGCSINAAGIIQARGYGLTSGSLQDEAVGPCMGTCIRRGKAVDTGKHGGWIGTGEVYVAIDNRVWLSSDRHGDGDRKRGTCGCSGGS